MYWMTCEDGQFAYGLEHGYLVLASDRDVRLSRFPVDVAAQGLFARVAAETVRNVIVFPLGRGPGRPGGPPELAALAESAKAFAEAFEAGEDLEHYPGWQHRRPAGDANDCPNC